MSAPTIEVSIRVSEEEFAAWNRRALRTDTDLSGWVRAIVNLALAEPTPRPPRSTAPIALALHRLDEEPPYSCEYCGFDFDFTATMRRRFCSDLCRVKAWRLRKRLGAANEGKPP